MSEYLKPDERLLEDLLKALEIRPDELDYDRNCNPEVDPIRHAVAADYSVLARQEAEVAQALFNWIPRSLDTAQKAGETDLEQQGVFSGGIVWGTLSRTSSELRREAGKGSGKPNQEEEGGNR